MTARTCSVDGCDRPAVARGWCKGHYGRWWRNGDPLAPKKMTGAGPVPIEQRFWAKVESVGDCWEWTGARTERGYGQIRYRGRTTKAHRVAWLITTGEIPAHLCVLHSCDNPPCVNPAHLFLGTLKDNSQDCVQKGRHNFQTPEMRRTGLDHPQGKLSDEDVAILRGMQGHLTAAVVARIYNVTPEHVRLLWRRVQRPHVLPIPYTRSPV